MNDWNSGKSYNKICKLYKIKNRKALNDLIYQWRHRGYRFMRDRERYMTVGEKGINVTAVWEDELTDSESTSAGCVRQTRGSE